MVPDIVFVWAMVLVMEGGGTFDTGLRYDSAEECEAAVAAATFQLNDNSRSQQVVQQMVCLPTAGDGIAN
ncbi:hypothetical protein [Gymnodinialimonas hymeniacidonis]|uniref:hypothetical protein n=1 Tax=Gymnodinialimonas hymeniacidonis TaxID=3126508 RepID=UPI0034C5F6FD